LRKILSAFLLMVLTGCVTIDPKGIKSDANWTIHGKISVRAEGHSGVYKIKWTQKDLLSEIVLFSSLGIKLIQLEIFGDEVEVKSGYFDEEYKRNKQIEEDISSNFQILRKFIPYLINGQKTENNHLPLIFQEGSWSIKIADHEGEGLETIDLEHPRFSIRMKILNTDN